MRNIFTKLKSGSITGLWSSTKLTKFHGEMGQVETILVRFIYIWAISRGSKQIWLKVVINGTGKICKQFVRDNITPSAIVVIDMCLCYDKLENLGLVTER